MGRRGNFFGLRNREWWGDRTEVSQFGDEWITVDSGTSNNVRKLLPLPGSEYVQESLLARKNKTPTSFCDILPCTNHVSSAPKDNHGDELPPTPTAAPRP